MAVTIAISRQARARPGHRLKGNQGQEKQRANSLPTGYGRRHILRAFLHGQQEKVGERLHFIIRRSSDDPGSGPANRGHLISELA